MRKIIHVWPNALIDKLFFIHATRRDNGFEYQGMHLNVINGRLLSKFETIVFI